MAKIYLIGSLRNAKIAEIANKLRSAGHEVFDDWFGAGPEADDFWQKYEEKMPNLNRLALLLTNMPSSSAFIERFFSKLYIKD